MFELWQESFSQALQSGALQQSLEIIGALAPIWLPLLAAWTFISSWVSYIRLHNLMSKEYVLLEIKLPEEISRPVSAMELIFTAMYQASGPILFKGFWLGEVIPWFSLELVSIGGEVHFFIWSDKKYAPIVEHQIYAQYPDAEVVEVPDYTNFTESDPQKIEMWGTYFKQTGDETDPIKSYMDYGLSESKKPEETVDPMTSIIEYLGSIRKGEQVWVQILIRPHRETNWKFGESLFKKKEWKDKIEDKVQALIPKAEKDDEGRFKFPQPMAPGMDDYIKTLRRHQSKPAFDSMVRGMYIAEPDVFNEVNIVGLIGSFRQYNYHAGNGFKLGHFTDVGETWKNTMGVFPGVEKYVEKRRKEMKTSFFEAYRLRSFFYPPKKNHGRMKPYVLTTEELATIYHFPGGVAQTPTFKRIESKKAEPPSDLPI